MAISIAFCCLCICITTLLSFHMKSLKDDDKNAFHHAAKLAAQLEAKLKSLEDTERRMDALLIKHGLGRKDG